MFRRLTLSNPKLPLIAARAQHAVELALVRAVAHQKHPQQNPLPADAKSLERAFHDLFQAVPSRKRDDFLEEYQHLLDPAERTRAYGDVAQVNFASAVSVIEQVKSLPLPANLRFTDAELVGIKRQYERQKPSAALRGVPAGVLSFEVVSLTCVKPNDVRTDEVNLVVMTLDGFGGPFNAGPFFVGKFKKNDTITLGPQGKFVDFQLIEQPFPASFPASLFIVESDVIHDPAVVRKLAFAAIAAAGACVLVAATFVTLGLTGLVGAALASTIITASLIPGIALPPIGLHLIPALGDDTSEVASETLLLDQAPLVGEIFDRVVTVSGFDSVGGGQYTALLRWTAQAAL